MRTVESVPFIFQEVIKNGKNKVAKALSTEDYTLTLVVKEMVFKSDDPLLWLQSQIMDRLSVISSVNGKGVLGNLLEDHMLEALVIPRQEEQTVYLSKPYLIGKNMKEMLK